MGRRLRSLSLISRKSIIETALLSEGQASDTSCQVVLVDSSHFVDRDRVANERGAVCDGAKLLYKSLKMKGALLPTIRTTENIRSVQRYSTIREYSNNSFQPYCIHPFSSLLSMLGSHREQWEACVAAWRFVLCLAIVEGGKDGGRKRFFFFAVAALQGPKVRTGTERVRSLCFLAFSWFLCLTKRNCQSEYCLDRCDFFLIDS